MPTAWKHVIPIGPIIDDEDLSTRETVTRLVVLLEQHDFTKDESFTQELKDMLEQEDIDSEEVDGVLSDVWEFFDTCRIWGGGI